MTTATFDTRIRHDSDAAYQEWVQELHDQWDAIGLTQTADTGQANIPTLTRPAQGTFNAYEIRAFNDSLQGSAPIYLRFDFGTQNGVTAALLRATVGTATDGAGTLSTPGIDGSALTAQTVNYSQGGSPNNDTLRQSDFCHAEGFLGMSWKNINVGFGLPGIFAVCRTCDEDGTPDGRGILIDWNKGGGGNAIRQAVRFAAPGFAYPQQTTSPNVDLGFMPQAPASSAVGSDNQVALAWTFCERGEPLFGLCGVYPAQIALQSTFSLAMVGSTARTFKVINNWTFGNPSTMRTAMLWE